MCRRAAEGEHVRNDILQLLPLADVSVIVCELGDFASIRHAADRLLIERSRLDILIHNAGATLPHRTLNGRWRRDNARNGRRRAAPLNVAVAGSRVMLSEALSLYESNRHDGLRSPG